MRNIYVLPTDKPSRLIKNSSDKLILTIQSLPKDPELGCNPQNIYVTNDEEIKEGDWFIWKDTDTFLFKCIGLTDKDSLRVENTLIKKIGTYNRNPKDSNYGDWYKCYSKKIILTTDKDLIKDGIQAIDDEFLEWFVKNPSCEEVEVSELKFFNHDTNESAHCKWELDIPKEEPKQETLEEAADLWSIDTNNVHPVDSYIAKTSFIQGAKWQQNRNNNL